MRRRAHGTDSTQMPGDADVIVVALLAQLRRAHLLKRRARQKPFAARSRAVAKVKLRIGEQIGYAEADAACRDAGRRRKRPLQRRWTIAADAVAQREPLGDELAGRRAGMREAERRKHQITNGPVDR